MTQSNESSISRLLLFHFHDKDGIVDRYVTYLLEKIREHVKEIFVFSSSKLKSESRLLLESFSTKVVVKKAKVAGIMAYKTVLECYGWDKLSNFDEIIMMDSTIYGPLYPFSEAFDIMNTKKADFWGLTLHHGFNDDPSRLLRYGHNHSTVPLHINSHFIAVRKRMISSFEFKRFWNNLPENVASDEETALHDASFTTLFEGMGFRWDVYIDTRNILRDSYSPIVFNPLELIRDSRCPVITKSSFFMPYKVMQSYTAGEVTIQAVEFIKKNLSFDENLIWENIIRTLNQQDLYYVLALNYVLPTSVSICGSVDLKNANVALIFHAFYDDQIEYNSQYVMSVPSYVDIYFTATSDDMKEKIEKHYTKLGRSNIKVVMTKNQGRDVSSLLVAAKDIAMEYEYVCFAHDKKCPTLEFGSIGKSFAGKCLVNILASEKYIENIIFTFENNPKLGMLSPPPPMHSIIYFSVLGEYEWHTNFAMTDDLTKQLKLCVDIDFDKAPVAPLGTMFWFRTKALKKLFDYGFTYCDFPKEPIHTDATLLHAIERVYPLVVQDAGYYPAFVYADSFAKVELAALRYHLKGIVKALFKMYGIKAYLNLLDCMSGAWVSNNGQTVTEKKPFYKRIGLMMIANKKTNRFGMLLLRFYLKYIKRQSA